MFDFLFFWGSFSTMNSDAIQELELMIDTLRDELRTLTVTLREQEVRPKKFFFPNSNGTEKVLATRLEEEQSQAREAYEAKNTELELAERAQNEAQEILRTLRRELQLRREELSRKEQQKLEAERAAAEKQRAVEQLNQQLQQIENEKQRIQGALNNEMAELDTANRRVETLQSEIRDVEEDISAQRAEIEVWIFVDFIGWFIFFFCIYSVK